MKLLIVTIIFLSSVFQAFAYEGEEKITNLAEADWLGPIVALIIISLAIIISKIICKKGRSNIRN